VHEACSNCWSGGTSNRARDRAPAVFARNGTEGTSTHGGHDMKHAYATRWAHFSRTPPDAVQVPCRYCNCQLVDCMWPRQLRQSCGFDSRRHTLAWDCRDRPEPAGLASLLRHGLGNVSQFVDVGKLNTYTLRDYVGEQGTISRRPLCRIMGSPFSNEVFKDLP